MIRKKLLPLLIILAIAAAGYYFWQSQPSTTDGEDKATEETSTTEDQTDQETDTKGVIDQATPDDNNKEETSTPSANDTITVTITSAEHSGDQVSIRAITSAAKGKCTLKLSKSGQQTITKTASVGLVTSYYSCQGFDVDRSEFPVAGEWKVKITVDNGDETGSSTSQVKVQ